MIKISIDFLIKGIGVLSIILVFLCIYVVLYRIKGKTADKKIKNYIQEKQDQWYQYLNDEISLSQELIPVDHTEMKAVEKIFLVYVKNVSSPIIQEKIRKFSNEYLRKYYSRLLRRKRWGLRMNALQRIVDFKIDSLAEQCKKIEKKGNLSSEERFYLLLIQSIFYEAAFIEKFAGLSSELSEYEYKKLLIGFDSEILKQLTYQMHKFAPVYQYYFIDVLGIRRNLDFLPFLEDNFSHEDSEIRIRSLKAISEIGIIINLNKYKVFLDSPLWEERLMLTKILGAFSLEQVYPYLEKLLQDENWQVRSSAAKTIGVAKDGKSRLEAFIATAQDQYAIDMAREVLGGES